MTRRAIVLLCVTMVVSAKAAAPRPDLSGTWTLNREISDFPKEVGFDPDWQDSASPTGGRSGGGQSSGGGGGGGRGGRGGGRGGGGGGSSLTGKLSTRLESEEDSKKIRELVNEVKNPANTLTITQTDAAVTIAEAYGHTRTYHTSGKEDTLQLEAGPIGAVSKWEPTQFVVRYKVEKDRELRYAFSRAAGAPQLRVTVQFAERGRGEVISRVYDLKPN